MPWVHDCKNTDVVIAVDDEAADAAHAALQRARGREGAGPCRGGSARSPAVSTLLGISGIANVLAAIKFAKYFELTGADWVVSIATDSMDLYRSRLAELTAERGEYRERDADRDLERLAGIGSIR